MINMKTATPIFFDPVMFETSLMLHVTDWAERRCAKLDAEYFRCWQPLTKRFRMPTPAAPSPPPTPDRD